MAVNTLETLIDDPHLADVGFFEWVDHPTQGRIRSMRGGSTWSKTPAEFSKQAPLCGENTLEVLQELGYSQEEIDAMLESGAARSVE